MADDEKIDTVVLAGGVNHIPLFTGAVPSCKALLPFAGKPCVQYVLDALKEVPDIGRVCLVGQESELRRGIDEPQRYEYAPDGRSFGGSVFSGLDHYRDSGTVLFLTADLPLLTSETVARFIELCRAAQGHRGRQVYLSGVDRRDFTGPFDSAPKRCSRFRDVTVCHGNLALLHSGILYDDGYLSSGRLDTIYRNRKKTLRTCWAFGWPFLVGYLFGGMFRVFTLEQVLRTASKRFKVDLVPIFMPDPGIAVDVDEPEDYEFALRVLKMRRDSRQQIDISLPNLL